MDKMDIYIIISLFVAAVAVELLVILNRKLKITERILRPFIKSPTEDYGSSRWTIIIHICIIIFVLGAPGYGLWTTQKKDRLCKDIFYAHQATKLAGALETIRKDTTGIVDSINIKSSRALRIVGYSWVCSHHIWDMYSDVHDSFHLFYQFSTPVKKDADRIRCRLGYLDSNNKVTWDTLTEVNFDTSYIANDSLTVHFRFSDLPVGKDYRLQLDIFKQGWQVTAPVSLIGGSWFGVAYPPKESHEWLFFEEEPWNIELLQADTGQIALFLDTPGSLPWAIKQKNEVIYERMLSTTDERPNWSDWWWPEDFGEQEIMKDYSTRIHAKVVLKKRHLYAISFWQKSFSPGDEKFESLYKHAVADN